MKQALIFLITAVVCLTAALFPFSGKTYAAADELFTINTPPKAAVGAERSSLASVRESVIEMDMDAARLSKTDELSIGVFDSKSYRAVGSAEVRAIDDITWRGKIVADKFSGDIFFTVRKGYAAGMIYTPNAVYEIVAKGDRQYLVELDQSLFPECYGDLKADETSTRENIAPAGVDDSGDVIDVLIVYSTAVKNIVGGDAQAQALAQAAIDSANTAYINSKVRQRLRLVHSEEFVYTETTSASTDLGNLRNNAGIGILRDTHKADLVSLISQSVGVCGIGYLLNTMSGSPTNGFTVTVRSCAVGNLSFAHELGHNMGSQHNPENGSGAVFPYSYGHYVSGVFRTVTSYTDPCTDGCTRVAHFSNPVVNYLGYPTGIDDHRDNVRSLEQTADVVARYRYSGKSITLNSLNERETVPRNISRTVNWSSAGVGGNVRIELSRDESTHWETLIDSTPNDGSAVINTYGRPTRRAGLRVVNLQDTDVRDSSVRNFIIR